MTTDPSPPPAPTSAASVAWGDLLTTLGELGEMVEREAGDERERAEGYRHLTRLLSASAEWQLEKADPARPVFTRVMTPWRKFIGDNPDTVYDVADLAPDGVYRLTGERREALYLGLTVYGRDEHGAVELLAQAGDVDFVAADGSFEVVLGGDDPGELGPGGHWLPLTETVESLWVRQYFRDRDRDEPARLHLARIGETDPPARLTETDLVARLGRIGAFMEATLDSVTALSSLLGRQPNRPLMAGAEFHVEGENSGGEGDDDETDLDRLLLALSRSSYPTPDNRYAGVFFELEPDQALVVTGTPPGDARYWGVQLANRWQESLDYLHHQVCLHDAEIRLEADGTYRIVVSAEDPGAANWLDTTGHRYGMVNVRALLAADLPDPHFEVVPLAML